MPDAPTPTFGANGQLLQEWLVVVSFRPERAALTLSWNKDGDRWQRTRQGAVAYPQDDVADLLEGVATTVWMLHEPRLL